MTASEHEEICQRRENFQWGNGFSWGVTVSGVLFLTVVLIWRVWG